MDARQIYEALFNANGPAKEPSGQWRYIGDGVTIEEPRFWKVVAAIQTPLVYVASARNDGSLVPRHELLAAAQTVVGGKERLRMADLHFHQFLELSPVGVARAWGAKVDLRSVNAKSNDSKQRSPSSGLAPSGTWRPITAARLAQLIEKDLRDCEEAAREAFFRHRTTPYHASLAGFGQEEQVFVVARKGNEVIYYEDVEEGFNVSPVSAALTSHRSPQMARFWSIGLNKIRWGGL